MPAQITERPKRRNGDGDTTEEPVVSAQILQFPSGSAAEEIDPATALSRILQSLTKHQSVAPGREIGVLSAAIATEAETTTPGSSTEFPEGIRPRHSERCRSKRTGGECDCDPPWEASVWSTYDKKKIRKTRPTKQAAIKWRRKHLGLAESGQLRAPPGSRLRRPHTPGWKWRKQGKSSTVQENATSPAHSARSRAISDCG